MTLPPDPPFSSSSLLKANILYGVNLKAAEAAGLGIPAIFVSAEKFAYIRELEEYGLVFHYHPDQLNASLEKIDALLAGVPPPEHFINALKVLLRQKMDLTAFMIWFFENIPDSAGVMDRNQDYANIFIADS